MIFEPLRAGLSLHLTRHRLRHCAGVGRSPRVRGRVWIHGSGTIFLGDRVFLDAEAAPIELYAWRGAIIVVGDDTYLGGGSSIESTASIRLGARGHFGAFCRIIDNHFHPLVGDRNDRPAPRTVTVGCDVVLGPRSILLAGARVADGTRLGAASIVNREKDVP